jgi:Xaa-Pro aminopeptidase
MFCKNVPMGNKSYVSPFSLKTYQKRRSELVKKLAKKEKNFIALFWSGCELTRNYDSNFPFRAHSDFLYLTGFAEPETMILLKYKNGRMTSTIGVRPRDLSTDRGSEIWEGERIGVKRAPKALGFHEAFDILKMNDLIKKWARDTSTVFWNMGEFPDWDRKLTEMLKDVSKKQESNLILEYIKESAPTLHEMRKVKAKDEISVMRTCAEIASQAHIRGMQSAHPGLYEYSVAAEIEREFKKRGAQDLAYSSIVAAGNNACTLHYHENRDKLKKGELLLVDAGAELHGYASDITRTYPISGKFTKAQAEVYSWVLKAQQKAIQAAKPGASFRKPHEVAAKVISEGLKAMKIIKGKSAQYIYKKELYKKYFPHGTSHWLGLDVHDRGTYLQKGKASPYVKLKAGNVITIEPGIYFRKNDTSVPTRYRGIGIRIEDDILITSKSNEVLSKHCPKTIKEIEQSCVPRL